MLGGNGLEKSLRSAVFIALALVVVIAPAVGCFALSPVLVAWGLQPYPLAAALAVMATEALSIIGLLIYIRASRR